MIVRLQVLGETSQRHPEPKPRGKVPLGTFYAVLEFHASHDLKRTPIDETPCNFDFRTLLIL